MVLENGCLCCTVCGDLVGTLNNLYHDRREAGEIPPFDNVVIETSGLADPAPVLQAFLSDPTLDGLYRVGADRRDWSMPSTGRVRSTATTEARASGGARRSHPDHQARSMVDAARRGRRRPRCSRDSAASIPPRAISRADEPGFDAASLLRAAGLDRPIAARPIQGLARPRSLRGFRAMITAIMPETRPRPRRTPPSHARRRHRIVRPSSATSQPRATRCNSCSTRL